MGRSMRLDVPRFDGTDVVGWIFKATQFFEYHQTPQDQRILISSFHMEGPALSWFQWMHSNLIVSLPQFLQALKLRYGPSIYEDPKGKLAKLRQVTTVATYQAQFEEISTQIHGLSKDFLISFFISDLKPELRKELLVAQPCPLVHAMALAKLQEDKYNDLKQCWRQPWNKYSNTGSQSVPQGPTLVAVSDTTASVISLPLDDSSPFLMHHLDNPGAILITQPLHDDNYPTWRRAMRMALEAKHKLSFIDDSLPKPAIGAPSL
ncbi:uncharacterized protein LOC122064089 isoform X2 [Macadamia integrifolia]|uniref:uncharacterized protein LOC122064089 isoform X2 n=1 Tax=Macadamia integrifolia TaxID=60698 RepID=UPI001C4EF7AF|nr:uncharacterized protein LOC122064089 isoform X2 [Macadamia integrifolia]